MMAVREDGGVVGRRSRARPPERTRRRQEGAQRWPSRRSRARRLKFRTRQLIPDATDDDDPIRTPGLAIDADDGAWMKRVETGRTLARDQQRVTAREISARVAFGADPDPSTVLVHIDDGEAILLKPVGKALRHCENPLPARGRHECPSRRMLRLV